MLCFVLVQSLAQRHFLKRFAFCITGISAKWIIMGTVQKEIVYAPNFALCPILSWRQSPATTTPRLTALTFSKSFDWYFFQYT